MWGERKKRYKCVGVRELKGDDRIQNKVFLVGVLIRRGNEGILWGLEMFYIYIVQYSSCLSYVVFERLKWS